MDLAAVMDEVADRARTIGGLQVWSAPEGSPTAPFLVVDYPETITFDETYGRGMDRMTLPVLVGVAKPGAPETRDRLAEYCNGSGAASIKAVLESGTYATFDTLRVVDIDIDVYVFNAIPYMAALFTLDIAGPGSS